MKNEELFQLISELNRADGVSGHENHITSIVKKKLSELSDSISEDLMGNVIAIKKGTGISDPIRIMIAAHSDEIGLMVKATDPKGFLWVSPLGGVDRAILFGKKVWVHTKKGEIPGVIATRPPHLTSAKERSLLPDWDEFIIDVGIEEPELSRIVEVGDVCTLQGELTRLSQQFIAGKALDNRVGVTSIILMMQYLQRMTHDVDVYIVCTTQEEVGLRGAVTSAYGVAPHVAIAIDVGFAQQPGVNERLAQKSGQGPVIAKGPNIHPKVGNLLIDLAAQEGIPHQKEIIAAHSSTDAWVIQVSRTGIPTGLLSIPIAHMHSPVECCHFDDIRYTAKLLAEFISRLNPDEVRRWQRVTVKSGIDSRRKR